MLTLLPPERYDVIITNAGGCGSHLRHYGTLLADDPAFAARARLWDSKVRDIHEWLAETGARTPAASPFAKPVTLTYHDSCHLAHGQRVRTAPRALLRAIPGLQLIELDESDVCCGSAGVYNLMEPGIAGALLRRKVSRIRATGAEVVVTGNPGCLLQLRMGLAEEGLSVRAHHPVEVLAWSVEGPPDDVARLPAGEAGEGRRTP